MFDSNDRKGRCSKIFFERHNNGEESNITYDKVDSSCDYDDYAVDITHDVV